MTGFGKVTAELPTKKVTVEIKALNSKQLDLSTRIPSIYKEKEMLIRSRLLQTLERGKVDFSIYIEYIGKDNSSQINQEAVANYFAQLKTISETLGISAPSNWMEMQTILRMPDVIRTEQAEVAEEEWEVVRQTIDKAIEQLCEFRIQEGAMLQKLFTQKVENIANLLNEVAPYEKERVEKIKARILDNLEKLLGQDYDKNRFEQEMIYYIEKLDINEEKTVGQSLEIFHRNHGQWSWSRQEIGLYCTRNGTRNQHVGFEKQPCRDAENCGSHERRVGTDQGTSTKRIVKWPVNSLFFLHHRARANRQSSTICSNKICVFVSPSRQQAVPREEAKKMESNTIS